MSRNMICKEISKMLFPTTDAKTLQCIPELKFQMIIMQLVTMVDRRWGNKRR